MDCIIYSKFVFRLPPSRKPGSLLLTCLCERSHLTSLLHEPTTAPIGMPPHSAFGEESAEHPLPVSWSKRLTTEQDVVHGAAAAHTKGALRIRSAPRFETAKHIPRTIEKHFRNALPIERIRTLREMTKRQMRHTSAAFDAHGSPSRATLLQSFVYFVFLVEGKPCSPLIPRKTWGAMLL